MTIRVLKPYQIVSTRCKSCYFFLSDLLREIKHIQTPGNSLLVIAVYSCFCVILHKFIVKASVYSRNLFNKGCRVPLRGKVNEAVHTGLRVVDTILPIGRGQRQLVIGDRFTGKTNIYISTIINQNRNNFLKSIDGFGSKRVFGVYVGINQNLSRIYKIRICYI